MKTMFEEKQTCEQLIDDRLKDRLAELKDGMKTDEALAEVLESVLSVDKQDDGSIRVLLSWGGPSDGFTFTPNDDDWIVTYFYADWYDGSERQLEGHNTDLVRNVFAHVLL